jgi:hypothetical protein
MELVSRASRESRWVLVVGSLVGTSQNGWAQAAFSRQTKLVRWAAGRALLLLTNARSHLAREKVPRRRVLPGSTQCGPKPRHQSLFSHTRVELAPSPPAQGAPGPSTLRFLDGFYSGQHPHTYTPSRCVKPLALCGLAADNELTHWPRIADVWLPLTAGHGGRTQAEGRKNSPTKLLRCLTDSTAPAEGPARVHLAGGA